MDLLWGLTAPPDLQLFRGMTVGHRESCRMHDIVKYTQHIIGPICCQQKPGQFLYTHPKINKPAQNRRKCLKLGQNYIHAGSVTHGCGVYSFRPRLQGCVFKWFRFYIVALSHLFPVNACSNVCVFMTILIFSV